MKLIVSLLKQAKYRQEYPENVVSSAQREPVLRPPPIPESFLKEVAVSTKPIVPIPLLNTKSLKGFTIWFGPK